MADRKLTPNELVALDRAHVWHPFTQHKEWNEVEPLVIASAQGCQLVDIRGNRYLDGVSSLWVGVHGHGHPHVDAAIRAQLSRMAHSTFLGLTHEPGVHLAKALVDRAPAPLNRVFYSESGSSAVEVALKMAYQAQQQRGNTRRTRFAALNEAYHGDTLGAVSVGGIDLFHAVYKPLLFDTVRLPCPAFRENEADLAQAAIEILEAHKDEIAAIVVEPLVQGAAGMRMHSPKYLDPVLQAAQEFGALVIIDEVATGFGRTGTLFATEQLSTKPDFLCIGKGLTNGTMALSATLATEAVFEDFMGDPDQTFFHGHTYTGNPLACAAGLACLEVFDQEDTLAGLPAKASRLSNRLEALAELPWVHEVRQTSMMVGIEIRQASGEAFRPGLRTGKRICEAARLEGVVMRPLGDTLILMPPLSMHPNDLERLVRATRAAIMATLRG